MVMGMEYMPYALWFFGGVILGIVLAAMCKKA